MRNFRKLCGTWINVDNIVRIDIVSNKILIKHLGDDRTQTYGPFESKETAEKEMLSFLGKLSLEEVIRAAKGSKEGWNEGEYTDFEKK